MISTIQAHAGVAALTSDEELMTAVRGGDCAPFEQLFERYRQPIWGFFRRRVPDPAVAEDLAQNVFCGAA